MRTRAARAGQKEVNARGKVCLVLVVLLKAQAAAAAACYSKLSSDTFTNCQLVSDNYALHWTISGTKLLIGIEVDGQPGWMGFGLSEAGGMGGADIVTVINNGQTGWTAVDRWSSAFQEPAADSQQDYRLIGSVTQDSSSTAVMLERNITTCDENDLDVNLGVKQHIIWAHGDSWGYHGRSNRGNNIVTFGIPPQSLQSVDIASVSGLASFSISMPNVQVPVQDTAYLCLNFPVPSDKKYHVIEFTTIPATKYVHHTIVYACSGQPVNHTDGKDFDCLTEGKDLQCLASFAVWAPGVKPFTTPALAGYPFGKDEYQWFTFEIHYTNPDLDSGVIDNSTFTMQYTPILRKYDMGILTLGTLDINIPPGQSNVSISNLCPSSCTGQFNQSLTLLQSFFHMHSLGKKLITQHIQGSKELRPLGQRTAYFYDYQDPIAIPVDTATLTPGDALLTTCTYDSRGRTNVTTFGPRTADEMCHNFLAYYPRIPIDICMSLSIPGVAGSFCADALSVGNLQKAAMGGDPAAAQGILTQYVADGRIVTAGPLPAYAPFKQECTSVLSESSPPPKAEGPPPQGSPVASPPPPANDAAGHSSANAFPGAVVVALLIAIGWML